MTYVIGAECIDVLDRSCLDVCPVDCIYVGERKSYIHERECIDCGACLVECPENAIFADADADSDPARALHLSDSRAFFDQVLPGRDSPLGDPGGATILGDLGIDTPLVQEHPK